MYSSGTATCVSLLLSPRLNYSAMHCNKTPFREIRRHPLSPGAEYSELEYEESDTASESRRGTKEREGIEL